ncbi:hypothetical protein DDV98_27840 [Streptomyces sp. IB2014 011-12]|nr:hypothetical protein DDV98_27840 [Streptomyces sp. IB2014 011-12]
MIAYHRPLETPQAWTWPPARKPPSGISRSRCRVRCRCLWRSPHRLRAPAGGAETVSDGTAEVGGPGPSRSARIFVSRTTGACLDHSLDQKLRTYACNGLSYQRWTVRKLPDGTHQLRNHATGACLSHGEEGLTAVDCSASVPQKWSFTTWPDDSVEVRSVATGACLDDSAAPGFRAQPCTGTSRQQWG